MCCNKHLTSVEREMILKFRAIGCSITEIAQRLGRNKATVSRKLQRNSINGEYIPAVAEELYQRRGGQIQISHEIDERPASADKRSRLGDWEGDTVAGVTGKACIVTLVDRKSR